MIIQASQVTQEDIIEVENIEDIVIAGIQAIHLRIQVAREALALNHNQKATNK